MIKKNIMIHVSLLVGKVDNPTELCEVMTYFESVDAPDTNDLFSNLEYVNSQLNRSWANAKKRCDALIAEGWDVNINTFMHAQLAAMGLASDFVSRYLIMVDAGFIINSLRIDAVSHRGCPMTCIIGDAPSYLNDMM